MTSTAKDPAPTANNLDGRHRREPGATSKGRATRTRLMDAAQEELRAHGAVEIAAVATAAGVTQSVVYRYFRNKAQLVEAVVNRFYDQYDEAVFLTEMPKTLDWMDREALRVRQEVDFLYDHPLGPTVAAGLLHEAAAARVDTERHQQHIAMAARNIRHGQRGGELPADVDADLVGAAIMGALRSVLSRALHGAEPMARTDVTAVIARLSRALLDPCIPL